MATWTDVMPEGGKAMAKGNGTTHVDMRHVPKGVPVNNHPGPDLPVKEKEAEAN